jgi:hypothetical protein
LVVFFVAHDLAREQMLCAVKLLLRQHKARLALLPCRHALPDESDLVVYVLDGVSQLESLAPCLCHQSPHGRFGHNEVCICNINSRLLYRHLHAKGLGIELDEHVAFAHAAIVVH